MLQQQHTSASIGSIVAVCCRLQRIARREAAQANLPACLPCQSQIQQLPAVQSSFLVAAACITGWLYAGLSPEDLLLLLPVLQAVPVSACSVRRLGVHAFAAVLGG